MKQDTVWVLTSEYNDYDQHGEYFEAVFKNKPTAQQLIGQGVAESEAEWVLQGGGRREYEDLWYNLNEVELK